MPTLNHPKRSEKPGIKVQAEANLKIGRQNPAGSAHAEAEHIHRSRLWQDAKSLYVATCTALEGWPSSRRMVAERMIGNADAIHRRIGKALAAQDQAETFEELSLAKHRRGLALR